MIAISHPSHPQWSRWAKAENPNIALPSNNAGYRYPRWCGHYG
jgi:hypothetical protein